MKNLFDPRFIIDGISSHKTVEVMITSILCYNELCQTTDPEKRSDGVFQYPIHMRRITLAMNYLQKYRMC